MDKVKKVAIINANSNIIKNLARVIANTMEIKRKKEYKIENNMKLFEIWMEGFAVTGHHGVAQKLGEAYGTTFEDAIKNYMDKNPDSGIQSGYKNYHASGGYHIWGCKLYDNEKDARESFG